MKELIIVKKKNFQHFYEHIPEEALHVIEEAKPDDLLVLDVVIDNDLISADGIHITRARLYTRKVFDDILAGR